MRARLCPVGLDPQPRRVALEGSSPEVPQSGRMRGANGASSQCTVLHNAPSSLSCSMRRRHCRMLSEKGHRGHTAKCPSRRVFIRLRNLEMRLIREARVGLQELVTKSEAGEVSPGKHQTDLFNYPQHHQRVEISSSKNMNRGYSVEISFGRMGEASHVPPPCSDNCRTFN